MKINVSNCIGIGLAVAGLLLPVSLRADITIGYQLGASTPGTFGAGGSVLLGSGGTGMATTITLSPGVPQDLPFGSLFYNATVDPNAPQAFNLSLTRLLGITDGTTTYNGTAVSQSVQEITGGSFNVVSVLAYAGAPLSFNFSGGTVTVTPLGILPGVYAAPGNNNTAADQAQFLFTPVPEPTTLVAGALLLLPMGVSTLRVWRKGKA